MFTFICFGLTVSINLEFATICAIDDKMMIFSQSETLVELCTCYNVLIIKFIAWYECVVATPLVGTELLSQ